MKILIPRAFSHFREHKPSCEIRLICSYCRCAHFGSVSFPPPNRQSLKSVQSLDFVETLNFREGNDILYHLQGQLASGFKPRSHEGNDVRLAPRLPCRRASFNPRSREGNDKIAIFIFRVYDKFQSTFPRGERPAISSTGMQKSCFNPRSHEGNDVFKRSVMTNESVSIHVPTRGTTGAGQGQCKRNRCFNPRSHEGND